MLARKKSILSMNKKVIDEEYYDMVDYCQNLEGFDNLQEQDRLVVMRKYLEDKYV